ncbi:MAG: disulfide bond formation protein B [Candidatus Contendobacter odensis]|uniref:Disulfide bond formation protein B n=1 Tax=Candidatus Contendibacter odensensis TaxID=1400860 RepID=A0A2G6PFC7_9GAMM|nr:MAG: disulfide bond formation protein B [Candidatus Contendobacter odensis]
MPDSKRFGWFTRQILNGLGFLICIMGLGVAYYAQFVLDLEPCPLCIVQRLILAVVGLVFLLAAIHDPRGWGAKIYSVLLGLTAAIGAGIAARHVWIQHLPPDQAPGCGPGLAYMLETFPLSETIQAVLTGSGECAEVAWRFIGLSIPEWTLLLFLVLGIVGVLGNWRLQK